MTLNSITGREQIHWDQEAASIQAVNAFTFTAIVDGDATGTLSASCLATANRRLYACASPLPRLSAGSHVLSVRTTDANGVSSAISNSVPVTLRVSAATRTATNLFNGMAESALLPLTRVCTGSRPTRSCFDVSRTATNLNLPEQPAELLDGRIVVIDGGRLLVVEDGRVTPLPMDGRMATRVADVALAPDSDTTREVYVLEVTSSPVARTADVVRFRDVGGALGQRAVIVPQIALPAEGNPVLLVDDRIFIGIPRESDQLGLGYGTILRYDRRGGSAGSTVGNPVLAWGPGRPTALLRMGDYVATTGVIPGRLAFGLLGPGDATAAALPSIDTLAEFGGVRAVARTGTLVVLASADGSVYMSAADQNGHPTSLQRLDTRGAVVTGLTATRTGGIVATALLLLPDGTRVGRVYQLTPILESGSR